MFRFVAMAALLPLASIAHAQTVDAAAPPPPQANSPAPTVAPVPAAPTAGRILWRDVVAGEAEAAVRARYPAGDKIKHDREKVEIKDTQITEECEAESNIYFRDGRVDRVVVKGNPSLGGRCSDRVLTSLSSRYGQPLSDTRTEGSILAREGRVYVWMREGVELRFKRFSNGLFAGGGIGAASWELTYREVSDMGL